MIHPKVEEAFQEIDAAIFSGDSLEFLDFRERLTCFLKRWQQRLGEFRELVCVKEGCDRMVHPDHEGQIFALCDECREGVEAG